MKNNHRRKVKYIFLMFLPFGKFSFPPKKYDFLLCGKKLGEYTPLSPNVKWSRRTPGADPGFVVRGGMSRRGIWGPLKVPSWSRVEPW
jgi:hypothetical protein